MRKTIYVFAVAVALTGCVDKAQQAAETLFEQANKQLEEKHYNQALQTIDSLRKAYPQAIDIRKKALKLYQDVALKQAQDDLAGTDTLLQRVKHEYAMMKAVVDKAKAELKATPQELQDLTLLKMKLDSLQVRFDVECAKIKYIHKKQKE